MSKYGEWILLEPKASGMNLIVYALPVVLVILGAGFVWMLVRRWSNAPPSTTQPVPDEEEMTV